ncbi:uncharacterized protein LOC123917438 isoform X1 [Trifolium pratense]|uniref:uncharacterized protein LOC123917438 isoform X1 n=2 Tax=Trifolium pratense TaxID=57577 RepID=UPI001E6900B6|nr:uncharacterized protein LOC123917438 isoform X1 [Trifolium pratense]
MLRMDYRKLQDIMAENQRGPGRPRKNQRRNQREDPGGSQGVNENENPPIQQEEEEQQQQQVMMQMMQQFMQQAQQFMQQQQQGVHPPPEEEEIGNRVFREFYKMKPPLYEGSFNCLEAHGWLKEMEKVFKVIRCTEEEKVMCASRMLNGAAKTWWKGALAYMTASHIPVDWEHFQAEFLKKYSLDRFRFQKEQEFFQIKQGTMSVSEFIAKFEEMAQFSRHSVYSPDEGIEGWMINRFMFGLKDDIGHIVSLQSHNSFAELVQQCYIAEASLNKIHNEREQAW